MGNFGGHALPGSFFILAALWWTIMASLRHRRTRRRGTRFVSTASYVCQPSCCARTEGWPIEGFLKVASTVIGGGLEIITAIHGGHFTAIGNAQHATMFFYFLVSGVVDILMHFKVPLPPNSDYVMLSMAFMVEALLFKFHLHGRTELDILVHTLLLYTVYACVISVIAEMRFRRHLLAPLTRAYLTLLQGTWFWQIGFILYNPAPGAVPWKPHDHNQLTMVTVFFAWHALADFVIILVLSTILRRCCPLTADNSDEEIGFKRLIHSDDNVNGAASFHEDSDSDSYLLKPNETPAN